MLIGLMVTDPVFVAVMLLLVIPGTYIVDWIFHNLSVAWPALTGSALIVIGALLLEIPEIQCITWRGHTEKTKGQYKALEKGSGLSEVREVSGKGKELNEHMDGSQHTRSCTMSRTL